MALPRSLKAVCLLLLCCWSGWVSAARDASHSKKHSRKLHQDLSQIINQMTANALANAGQLAQTVGVPSATEVVTTISNNGLQPGWRSVSYGCRQCNFADQTRMYPRSSAGIYVDIEPWAAMVVEADAPFSSSSMLDFWIKGSGVTKMIFYLEDTTQRRFSKYVQVSNLRNLVSDGPLQVLGSTDDGWIRMQVNLQTLTTDSSSSSSIFSTSTLKITKNTWNRLIFRDVSGTGFTLQMDRLKLISLSPFQLSDNSQSAFFDTFPPITTAPFTNTVIPTTTAPTPTTTPTPATMPKLPVFNIDSPQATDEYSFVMKLKESTQFGTLRKLCVEMANNAAGSRFQGACDQLTLPQAPSTAFNTLNITKYDMQLPAWKFQSFKVKSMGDLEAMRSALADSVEYFERDMTVSLSQTLYGSAMDVDARSWGLDRLDQVSLPLNGVYSPGDLDGTNSHIYVLDTGIRWSHSDFSGRVGEGATYVGSSNWDDHGHGTHVAGTALGSRYGVAKKAILHAIKVLDSSGSGSYSNFISAMGWLKDHAKRNGYRQAVVSMSVGGPRSAALNDAVTDLANNGISIVVAAGNNNGGDACSYSPASAPNAITVGASTNSDSLSSFSNIGSCLFTFAPGSSITSASNAGDYAETTMSGTSMATPHVSGVVALYLQYSPGASVSEIKTALDRAAVKITLHSGSPSRLLNAMSSRLKPQTTTTTPTPSPTPSPTPTPTPSPSPRPSSPVQTTSPITFSPIFTSPSKPSWCSTCSWCMFCS